jgi:hypothetical protein
MGANIWWFTAIRENMCMGQVLIKGEMQLNQTSLFVNILYVNLS